MSRFGRRRYGRNLAFRIFSLYVVLHTRAKKKHTFDTYRPLNPTTTHPHTHFRVHSLKKGVSENEAPGPVGAYTTTHNNTPTPMPDRYAKLLTTRFDQECSFHTHAHVIRCSRFLKASPPLVAPGVSVTRNRRRREHWRCTRR